MHNRSLLMLFRSMFSILLMCTLYHGTANADKAIDLYSAEVLVINQTPAVRNKAAVNELATVFVRMSGGNRVLQNPRVRDAIKNASRYIYEFSYQSTDEEITLAGTQYPASLLQLKFTASPLEAILRDERLPFWPANRPEVLVWMAQSTDRQRYVREDSQLSQALANAAKARGLPTVRPILDLQDRKELSVAKIWAADERSILRAAERYKVDAVISGRIRKQGNSYTANFILNHQGETQYLQATGNTQKALADNIMAQTTRFFADIYAVVSGEQSQGGERLQLVVNNATVFSVYSQVIRYLQQVKLLDRAHLASVDDEELIFDISYSGNIEQLQQRLVLDKKLFFIEQKTVYETVFRPVNDKPANDTFDLGNEFGSADNIGVDQPIALPPIQEDFPILQLVFAWQQ